MARDGAGYLKKGVAVGLSMAVAGFKTIGRKVVEVSQQTGAFDKLSAEMSPNSDVNGSSGDSDKKGKVIIEIGSAGIDAALDVLYALKTAAIVVADQSERTAVQVAGDLYGEEARDAAKSGVGAVADVGRAGAKIFQFAGDTAEVALEVAIEAIDQTVSMDDFLLADPVCEGPMKCQDAMTFVWNDRFVSLSQKGLLVFLDEETCLAKAKAKARPPLLMVSADDLERVEKEGDIRIVLRTRDHVIRRFEIASIVVVRDSWFASIVVVQQSSRRYIALARGGS
jgi:hypothetical protein